MSPIELAEKLTNPARHNFQVLVQGFQNACAAQFGAYTKPGRSLVLLWARHCAYSDSRGEIIALNSCPDVHTARADVKERTHRLLLEGATRTDLYNGPALNLSAVPTIECCTVRFEGKADFDRRYITTIALGPFPAGALSLDLIDMFQGHAERFALWSFFIEWGTTHKPQLRTWLERAKELDSFRSQPETLEERIQVIQAKVARLDTIEAPIASVNPSQAFASLQAAHTASTDAVPVEFVHNPSLNSKSLGVVKSSRGSAWARAQILWNTNAMTEDEKLTWIENQNVSKAPKPP